MFPSGILFVTQCESQPLVLPCLVLSRLGLQRERGRWGVLRRPSGPRGTRRGMAQPRLLDVQPKETEVVEPVVELLREVLLQLRDRHRPVLVDQVSEVSLRVHGPLPSCTAVTGAGTVGYRVGPVRSTVTPLDPLRRRPITPRGCPTVADLSERLFTDEVGS